MESFGGREKENKTKILRNIVPNSVQMELQLKQKLICKNKGKKK